MMDAGSNGMRALSSESQHVWESPSYSTSTAFPSMQATTVADFGIFVAVLSTTISEANKLLSLVPAPPLPNRRLAASIFSNHAISANVTLIAMRPVSSIAPASGGESP